MYKARVSSLLKRSVRRLRKEWTARKNRRKRGQTGRRLARLSPHLLLLACAPAALPEVAQDRGSVRVEIGLEIGLSGAATVDVIFLRQTSLVQRLSLDFALRVHLDQL